MKDLDNNNHPSELVRAAKKGSQRAFSELVLQYTPLIESECLRRAGATVEMDELKQAAMLGLYGAVCSYEEDRGVTFGAFARVCISNRLDSELRRARPSDEPLDDQRIGAGITSSPEESYILREDLIRGLAQVDQVLTEYERRVFLLYLSGESYKFIAARLGKTAKSVDGAIRRSKEKLRRALGED